VHFTQCLVTPRAARSRFTQLTANPPHYSQSIRQDEKRRFTFDRNGATLAPLSQEKCQMETNIRSLVEGFVNQIVSAVEADSVRRVQQAVTAAFAGNLSVPSHSGRPAKGAVVAVAGVSTPIKHRPKQFCPVPGCTGVAAPVFGMVCSKHKDLSKAKIKEYRAQRRAAKSGRK
jgi:hypothetical protein